ncbi:FadR/GntR family transcriptional regulator [Allostreptomyces psammosilenae]|uniref:DNA-binding FadR family transcriptional regulator n=1 Tax=Allostreptomyces psammosilenae TaxID=1892865 RepID=A0A852ZPI6_9ACTN|nr:FadR/GntR family transcriptional regulator [Allostreptomyces psammosilenae]NYI03645.1 DNA-binding FadR family transcriptional regulator [Allostreptomyces psammosilenae]
MTVTDAAIDRIRQMIIDGTLRPGDRLPRESDLAERLGLSRSSLREAVRALSLVHVLDVRHGDGTYVSSLDPGLLADAMGFVVDLHRDDTVLHFLEVRRILEPAATAMAATTMSDADAAGLGELLDTLGPEPTVDALVACDLEFHRRIAAGSGNPVLCSLIDGLSGPLQRARIWRGLTQQEATARTLAEHRAIQEAIAGRRPEVARAWATVHIAGLEDWLRRAL